MAAVADGAEKILPEKILKQLRELWVELGQSQQASGGVLRACANTLIVAAEPDAEGRDAEAAHRTIGVLMHDHPSRAIVVSPREGGAGIAQMDARVFSECWMPFGGQKQICAEGIEIAADSEQMDEVARVLVPLLAPDLPVILWCRGARAFRDRALDPLFSLADKIIFDTARVRHAPSAIEFLRRMRKGRPQVADLEWTRLTGWREAVANLFSHGVSHGVADVTAVQVQFRGERPGTGATYFARWIERALSGARVTLTPDDSASPAAGVCGVTFHKGPQEISIHCKDSRTLEVCDADTVYASPLPGASEEMLMREELSILGRDPVFDQVLQ